MFPVSVSCFRYQSSKLPAVSMSITEKYNLGYTILENVLLANGALYLVHNLASQIFPKTEMILSTGIGVPGSNLPPVSQELKFLTRSQALDIIGYGAHRFVFIKKNNLTNKLLKERK